MVYLFGSKAVVTYLLLYYDLSLCILFVLTMNCGPEDYLTSPAKDNWNFAVLYITEFLGCHLTKLLIHSCICTLFNVHICIIVALISKVGRSQNM